MVIVLLFSSEEKGNKDMNYQQNGPFGSSESLKFVSVQ